MNFNEKNNIESLDNLIASAKENNIDISVEEAKSILENISDGKSELSDEDMDKITGGGLIPDSVARSWMRKEKRRKGIDY